MNTLGAEPRNFAPINEDFKGLKEVEQEQALINAGLTRLRDLQAAPVEGVIDAMSKVMPEGLPWEGWRRSKNVEDFRNQPKRKKKEK